MIRDALRSAAGNFSRCYVHLVHECAKISIVDHALKEFLILASGRRFSGKKKIVQPHRGGAERVRFDDIRAGFEVLSMNFLDDFGFG